MHFGQKDNKYILHKNYTHTADDYIYALLNTYVYKYPYFTFPNNNDSTIHSEQLSYHNYAKTIAEKNWKTKYNKTNLMDMIYPDRFVINNIMIVFIVIIISYLFVKKYFY